MLKTALEVQVGDVIVYESFQNDRRTVLVDEVSQDIKNGRGGFAGSLVDDPTFFVWGYFEQIVRFISHAGEDK